jgi:hypothetical protein
VDARDERGHDSCEAMRFTVVLTLILYDIIPNDVRSARGRSHEASCGWERMRRPRPGENASPAPGRRRELRPALLRAARQEHGHRGPTARRALRPKCEGRRGQRTAPVKRGPGKRPRWRAMRRPRLSRGSAAQNEQWLRHLARHLPHLGEGDRSDDGAPGAKKIRATLLAHAV